ncbi:MAG TPA: DUF3341 domain-containing protein [Trueperaceae bacterium]
MSDVTTTTGAQTRDLYGLVAEFDSAEEILAAADATRAAGYTRTDAYTPFAVEGLDERLGMKSTRIGWIMLLAGTIGGFLGFYMQWFANVVHYPLNIGGRPFNSWPNFIVITFECTVLVSAFTVGLVMLARNGLPRPYHPIFNTPNFENATRDKFFLCIEASDPNFDLIETRRFLERLSPTRLSEVER